MLLWFLLLGGMALAAGMLATVLAMGRAERRARRSLFRMLGLPEETVELLMARNGDVLAELALVRRQDLSGLAGVEPAAPEATAGRPAIRLVHPQGPAAAPSQPVDARPSGNRRRLGLPGRQGRP